MNAPHREVLKRYAALVRLWSERVDLIAPGDLDRFEQRHIHDSLRLLPLLDELAPATAVDVGSGAGLPGVPLAVAAPQVRWTLLEPRHRRAAFLEEVARALDLSNVTVRAETAEEAAASTAPGGGFDLAVARALAPPERTGALLLPLVRPDGHAVIFIGQGAALPPGSREWRPGIAIVRREG